MAVEQVNSAWREKIFSALRQRNENNQICSVLVESYNTLQEKSVEYRAENERLTKRILQLENEITELHANRQNGSNTNLEIFDEMDQNRIKNGIMDLENQMKILNNNYNRMVNKRAQIMELRNNLQEKETFLIEKDSRITELEESLWVMANKCQNAEQNSSILCSANQVLNDEVKCLHEELEFVNSCIKDLQQENRNLLEKWMNDPECNDSGVASGSTPSISSVTTKNSKLNANVEISKSSADAEISQSNIDIENLKSNVARSLSESEVILQQKANEENSSVSEDVAIVQRKTSRVSAGVSESTASKQKRHSLHTSVSRLRNKLARLCKSKRCTNHDALNEYKHRPTLSEFYLTCSNFSENCQGYFNYSFEANNGEVTSVAWSSDASLYATGGSDCTVKLWKLGHRVSEITLVGCNAGITSIDFAHSERLVLASSYDSAARIWSTNRGILLQTLTGHKAKVMSAKFMGNDKIVVTGSHDRTVKIWDFQNCRCVSNLSTKSFCNDIGILDGNCFVSAHMDKIIRFWDLRFLKEPGRELELESGAVSLAISADKSVLLACTKDSSIQIIDPITTAVTSTLSDDGFRLAGPGSSSSISISPDGRKVAAGSRDCNVYIWDIDKGNPAVCLKSHQAAVLSCAWSSQPCSLVTADKRGTVTLWIVP